uniref:Uncharacterized protein n=2 Tax=Picea TaxID=3328 RepID=A0A101LXS5_PICGL|nr:hypothetical protein ABT39_MTgene5476 [Picea glauca]QHR91538.1 hypothetical protein Q903MT_gene5573 [Picea sitchensis]
MFWWVPPFPSRFLFKGRVSRRADKMDGISPLYYICLFRSLIGLPLPFLLFIHASSNHSSDSSANPFL